MISDRVGIGTTSPGQKLSVAGTASFLSDVLRIDNSWNPNPTFDGVTYTTRASVDYPGDASDSSISFHTGGHRLALVADGPIMSLESGAYFAGKVGIGTPGPEAKLHVANGGFRHGYPGEINIDASGIIGGRFKILDNGNVGIGTTSPNEQLEIAAGTGGRFAVTDGNGANRKVLLLNGPSSSGNYASLFAYRYGGTSAGGLNLAINENGGNVGIGTPSPDRKLDVNGDAVVRGKLQAGWMQTEWQYWPPDYQLYLPFLQLLAEDYYTVLVPPPGGFRVTDYRNTPTYNNLKLEDNGNLTIRGTITSGSDSRMKANQEPLDYGLVEVLKLRPMRFVRVNWTMDPETGELQIEEATGQNDFGLIAQDVYEIMPEAVEKPEDESTDFWSLGYDKLVAVLAKAIQEQQQTITNQQAKIESLEQRITALEQK